MKSKKFEIETILSMDVLGKDVLSMVIGGSGSDPICTKVTIDCPRNNCDLKECVDHVIICAVLGCNYSKCDIYSNCDTNTIKPI